MQDIELHHWPVGKLIPYGRNPRKNDHVIEQMAGAIQEFGFRIPIIAKSTGEVVDGHLRLKAALHLGLETVPVVLADDLTPMQIKAFRILANRSATWADWDEDLLRLELEELQLDDFDLSLTGFDDDEIAELLAGEESTTEGQTDEDAAPEVPVAPVSKSGDVWICGQHRVLCGDSTEAASYDTLLGNERVAMIFQDPPLYYYLCNELDGFHGVVSLALQGARSATGNAKDTAPPAVAEHLGGTPSRATGCRIHPWAKSP